MCVAAYVTLLPPYRIKKSIGYINVIRVNWHLCSSLYLLTGCFWRNVNLLFPKLSGKENLIVLFSTLSLLYFVLFFLSIVVINVGERAQIYITSTLVHATCRHKHSYTLYSMHIHLHVSRRSRVENYFVPSRHWIHTSGIKYTIYLPFIWLNTLTAMEQESVALLVVTHIKRFIVRLIKTVILCMLR